MAEEKLREQLYNAYKNRAILYWLIFDEMRKEIGEEKATEIMTRAIYARGRQKGGKFAQYAPNDLAGLKQAFVGGLADEGRMFDPDVIRDEPDALDIKFRRCPLKEAWFEIGLPEGDVAKMCRIAARVDNGTFEGAGFNFSADTFQPGGDGCCYLHIRPGTGSEG